MRILHFSHHDIGGGAAKAAYRLHKSLSDTGHSSKMFVRNKQSQDDNIKKVPSLSPWRTGFRKVKRHIPLIRENLSRAKYVFNLDIEPDIDTNIFFSFKPEMIDIICLHWITNFLTVKIIRKIYDCYRSPIVWLLMDQEPFTGGCHYSLGCDGFKKQCGNCPQINSNHLKDRSRVIWNRKYKYLRDLAIVFVAGTYWIEKRFKESSLFRNCRVEYIPIPIDTSIFHPFDKNSARKLLNVPQNKKIVFFGSYLLDDPRKGMHYLVEALNKLLLKSEKKESVLAKGDIFLLTAGRNDIDILKLLSFSGKHLGYIRDDVTLALAYQAADIFICPSIEDAGPMMIPESMLCGTPVVAFNTGGAPDLIEHMRTGYLAKYKNSSDLVKGVYSLLIADNPHTIRSAAHKVAAAKHSSSEIVKQHLDLYNSLLNNI